jgi:hypothetical protein
MYVQTLSKRIYNCLSPKHKQKIAILYLLSLPLLGCAQQQEADRDYTPIISKPLYESGKGPVILIDGGHFNFHTLEDKFAPFGKIAEQDGFRVKSTSGNIKAEDLKNAKILVIANALNEKNIDSWQQPVHTAFTPEEVKEISNWVRNGGRLFLIADHMPFAGAAADLAKELGFSFNDGFALSGPKRKFDVFSRAEGTLTSSELTDMHGSLDSIVTFTGQAFKIPDNAKSVITLDSKYKVLMPEVAWEFSGSTKMIPADGLSQLAYCSYGKGKVVVSGEAAMFTAQKVGDIKFGLNAPLAPHNLQLLLNILEWLDK